MKRILLLLLLTAVTLIACQEEPTPQTMDDLQTEELATVTTPDSVLRHAVFFAFQDDATDEQITEVQQAFSNLPNEIEEIRDYEWGTNNSPEGLNKGFTHAFFVTFESEEDRATYLPHPAHQAFVEVLQPIVKDVFVVDYWARED
ncbi:stress responsive alpha/beta barrel protein [Neolewinella xylanilytica]|uniref:Stress responsive alpha/beta barrel protein n=1 Tax=Neolewinella xylanilytica TaxID=1514080 RepID=A0A2S6I116_9BACT|nr:Dabb family protein [Neolewinella xylanilytica]PPK84571.1 stress responsive alpha/beta barrel protein [Neolewinella xylanilytica]